MSNLIEFPKKVVDAAADIVPSYAGHILMLDLTKARKWQCFGFWVGANSKVAVVPEIVANESIHAAVQSGILIDITDHPELFVPQKSIAEVVEHDTGKKIYSGTAKFFFDLGCVEEAFCEDETVAYATDNREEQEKIEKALANAPLLMLEQMRLLGQVHNPVRKSLLVLAPGMDNPEKYLIAGNVI